MGGNCLSFSRKWQEKVLCHCAYLFPCTQPVPCSSLSDTELNKVIFHYPCNSWAPSLSLEFFTVKVPSYRSSYQTTMFPGRRLSPWRDCEGTVAHRSVLRRFSFLLKETLPGRHGHDYLGLAHRNNMPPGYGAAPT